MESLFANIVGLTNPSNLDLVVGDVTFQLFQEKNFLGTTVLPVRLRDFIALSLILRPC